MNIIYKKAIPSYIRGTDSHCRDNNKKKGLNTLEIASKQQNNKKKIVSIVPIQLSTCRECWYTKIEAII